MRSKKAELSVLHHQGQFPVTLTRPLFLIQLCTQAHCYRAGTRAGREGVILGLRAGSGPINPDTHIRAEGRLRAN